MEIVVIHDAGVDVFKKWSDVKRFTSYSKDDFTQHGVDYVLNLTGDSYEVAKDIKLLERVASERIFAKQGFGASEWMLFALLGLTILQMV